MHGSPGLLTDWTFTLQSHPTSHQPHFSPPHPLPLGLPDVLESLWGLLPVRSRITEVRASSHHHHPHGKITTGLAFVIQVRGETILTGNDTKFAPAERADPRSISRAAELLGSSGLIRHITDALPSILMILNPSYQMRLFTPGPTLCIPIGAGLGIVVGFIIMRRIVDIEV